MTTIEDRRQTACNWFNIQPSPANTKNDCKDKTDGRRNGATGWTEGWTDGAKQNQSPIPRIYAAARGSRRRREAEEGSRGAGGIYLVCSSKTPKRLWKGYSSRSVRYQQATHRCSRGNNILIIFFHFVPNSQPMLTSTSSYFSSSASSSSEFVL